MPKNKWNGPKVLKDIKTDIQKKLELIGQYVEGQAIKEISAGPNQAVDTGRLKNSLTHELGRSKSEDYVRIGTNVEYGPYVELGTWKMGPRPFLRTALNKSKAIIMKILGS